MAARRAGMAGIVERMVEEGRLADGWTRREAIFMVALTSVDTYEDHKAPVCVSHMGLPPRAWPDPANSGQPVVVRIRADDHGTAGIEGMSRVKRIPRR